MPSPWAEERAAARDTAPAGVSVGAAPDARGAPPTIGAPRPNPTAGRTVVPVHVAVGGPLRVSVLDVLGREVAGVSDGHATPGVQEASFDAAGWAPGVYLVRVSTASGRAVRTFTVHR